MGVPPVKTRARCACHLKLPHYPIPTLVCLIVLSWRNLRSESKVERLSRCCMPSDQFFSLPLEQQVGQFFFIGLPGTTIDAETRELIEEIKPGGIILFGRNVEDRQQVRELLDGARALVPIPPLIGIDQEGGLVDRLRPIFPPMPSARALRQHGDLAGVRTLGRVTGELLRMLGFNINFAPVMSIITK